MTSKKIVTKMNLKINFKWRMILNNQISKLAQIFLKMIWKEKISDIKMKNKIIIMNAMMITMMKGFRISKERMRIEMTKIRINLNTIT